MTLTAIQHPVLGSVRVAGDRHNVLFCLCDISRARNGYPSAEYRQTMTTDHVLIPSPMGTSFAFVKFISFQQVVGIASREEKLDPKNRKVRRRMFADWVFSSMLIEAAEALRGDWLHSPPRPEWKGQPLGYERTGFTKDQLGTYGVWS